jgi:hypothetical protein
MYNKLSENKISGGFNDYKKTNKIVFCSKNQVIRLILLVDSFIGVKSISIRISIKIDITKSVIEYIKSER